jgi:hypothetical protein
MPFRKGIVGFVVCLVLAATTADAAQAAQWTVGAEGTGPGTTLLQEEVEIEGGPLTLTSTVLGTPISLTAKSVECSPEIVCFIFGAGESRGRLTYANIKVDPSTCSVNSPGQSAGTIQTKPLVDKIIMDPIAGSTVIFDKFSPASGTTFAEIELTGASCPFSELSAKITGTLTGESLDPTGHLTVDQLFVFGSTQQTTGGGSLKLGTATAVLSGVINTFLGGINFGWAFGAD